jgi:methylated-DNA-[protein]-cysteine S-methyltransferase
MKTGKKSEKSAGPLEYSIFETAWGYFAIAADYEGLVKTVLPGPDEKIIENHLKQDTFHLIYNKNLYPQLQKLIVEYFKGEPVYIFSDKCRIKLNMPYFSFIVLSLCSHIGYGETVTYAQLATLADNPKAARAVGNILAKNPMPLVIPCHRIIKTNGQTGGFSAAGSIQIKKKLLEMETKNANRGL